MSAAVKPPAGISNARALVLQEAATSLLTGLEALAASAGPEEGDTISAVLLGWFVDKLRDDAEICLRISDCCEPEPE